MKWAILLFLYFMAQKKGQQLLAPLQGTITSPFGNRLSPHTGQPVFHNGVDIAVPIGTPIIAPTGGTINNVYTTTKGGLQMVVDHANGYQSGYAHLSKVYFGPGVSVPAGKLIAESGASGQVTGPHLHFTWKKDGTFLDPQEHFKFS